MIDTNDDFYRSHRLSALGEPSYRAYIINKIKFIQKYTDEDNLANAWRSILLGTINNYHVPVQFTRYLIRSIKRRFTKINPRFNPIRAKDIATICNNKNDK